MISTESLDALTAPASSATAPHANSGCTCAASTAAGAELREHAILGQLLGAGGKGLLAWLKHRQQRHRERVAEHMRRARKRDQRRHVHVVSARVHRVAAGAEGRVRALADRQAVQLGANRQRRTCRRTDPREAARTGHRDARSRQRLGDDCRGAQLLMSELGLLVQAVAQLDRRRRSRRRAAPAACSAAGQ